MDFSSLLTAIGAPEPEQHGRPQIWALIVIVLLLMVVAVSLLGPSTEGNAAPAATETATPAHEARVYTVTYRFGIFSPTNLRIHAGDTVRFRNDSTTAVRIIADPLSGLRLPEFDSIGPVEPGATFGYTFANSGTFTYRNQNNSNQAGVIIVR